MPPKVEEVKFVDSHVDGDPPVEIDLMSREDVLQKICDMAQHSTPEATEAFRSFWENRDTDKMKTAQTATGRPCFCTTTRAITQTGNPGMGTNTGRRKATTGNAATLT